MARHFGGKYSPPATDAGTNAGTGTNPGTNPGTGTNAGTAVQKDPWRGKRRTRAGARVNALFLAPLPLAVRAFFRPPGALALMLGGLGLLLLAAWLTREGILAQEAYEARKVARRPAFPRKIFASVLTGAGLLAAVVASGGSMTNAAIFALLGAVLHGLAFGPDPLRDKGMDGIDTFQQDRVARAVDEAEKHLAAMHAAIARAGDRKLEARVERFEATARDMFRTVEDDPRDLTSARRYLGVYLLGARDATIRFADLYARSRDAGARADYEAFLDDLEANFATRTRTLLLDERNDMNVEIEVLRERLEREGVHMRTLLKTEGNT